MKAFALAEGFEIIAEFTEIETGKGSDALDRRPDVNGGRNPGHCGGAKAGQFELGGGRSRSALFDSAVASERPVGFGRVVEAQTIPGSTAGA